MTTKRKTTIYELPTETLCDIFILYRNGFAPPSLGWIIISHVCQTWRTICLAHAALWDVVNIRSPIGASEVLSRARHAPALYVRLPARQHSLQLLPSQTALLERLTDTRWRICDVDVIGGHDEVRETLRAVAHSSAHVRALRIANWEQQPSAPIFDAAPWGGAFPQLHILVLRGYCLNLSSPAYSCTLRSLTIDMYNSRAMVEYDLPPGGILDLLKRLSHIEYLVLRFCSSEVVPIADKETICLYNVRYLEIVDKVHYCARVLQRLTVPVECEISVDFRPTALVINALREAMVIIFDEDTRDVMSSVSISVNTREIDIVSQGITTRRVRVHDDSQAEAYLALLGTLALMSTSLISSTLTLELDYNARISPTVWLLVGSQIRAKNVCIVSRDIRVGLFPLVCTEHSCRGMGSLTVDGLDFSLQYQTTGPIENAVLSALEERGMPRSSVCMRNCVGVDQDILERWKGCVWVGPMQLLE